MKSVTIMGNSISARLAAAYLKQKQPDLNIVMIGPEEFNLPVVGESLIEMSTNLLFELGLSGYLEENHFHKTGLTFYMKEDIDDPRDRTYAVHESPSGAPIPSFQLNRFAFRKCLDDLTKKLGVRSIDAKIKRVDTSAKQQHTVTYEQNGNALTQQTNWVIDATGRRRLLARQHDLVRPAPIQRSVYWFRLKNFDRHFLEKINAVKKPQHAFDSYFATHHFMGKGNWIWCIPMKSEDGYMISIGITWRPDLYAHHITSIDDFCKYVALEHPVIADVVKSGTVDDENRYYNYLYETSQFYSEEGWFLIGDAANAVDPLYSVGLAGTALQIQQINAMIQKGQHETLDAAYVRDLEVCHRAFFHTVQDGVTQQYEYMHDPYHFHFQMHMLTALYFYFLLPCWLARYHIDPVGARFIPTMIYNSLEDFDTINELLAAGSKRLGKLPAKEIRNYYDIVVNWEMWNLTDEKIPKYISRMIRMLSTFRLKLLRNAGWLNSIKHLKIAFRDYLVSAIIRLVFGGRSFKRSPIIKFFLRKPVEMLPRPNQAAGEDITTESEPSEVPN